MNQIRRDGFFNVLSGLNTPGLDRSVMGGFNSGWQRGLSRYWSGRFHLQGVAELYFSNGIAAKIIDRPADDAFQRGLEIEGDDDKLMADQFDRLAVNIKMANALRWSRLYGGSALLLVARDGGEWRDPLNLDNLDEIDEIKVFDATNIRTTEHYYDDPNDTETFGKLEYYLITPPGVDSFEVHETRLIPVRADPLPIGFNIDSHGLPWMGRSALEGCIEDIRRYNQALDWSIRLLERKQQAVYGMQGLGEMFANGDDQIVQQRINMIDLVRGNLNSVVVDKEDTYEIQNLGLDGIQSLIEEYQISISASSNMPVVVLFGKAIAGLGATQKGNLESYYSMVSHIQQTIAKQPLEKLTSILWLQRELKNRIPDNWSIVFNPLWMPDESQQAVTKKDESTADMNNISNLITLMNNGILQPEEVRRIVVNDIYPEYGFPDASPSTGGDIDYAEGVDLSQLTVTEG